MFRQNMKRLDDVEAMSEPLSIISAYITDTVAVQQEMLERLAERKNISLSELAELLEDSGNRFLDISDLIRDKIISDCVCRPGMSRLAPLQRCQKKGSAEM
jgi:hypothetical protein